MKKLLSLSSITNATLRNREGSLFRKTAIHRYHNESEDKFHRWLKMLTSDERKEVKNMFIISNADWDEKYNLPYGRSRSESRWTHVIKIIKERKNHFAYYNDIEAIKILEKKFSIKNK